VRDDLAAAGVDVVTGVVVTETDGRLIVQPGGESLEGQSVIALPRARARNVKGLPADEGGFIPVDEHGRVAGTENVWAAGDAIAYPIKQGGLAAQQADAAAQAIAAASGADVAPQPFRPILRGVLLTGRDRHWIRRDLEDSEGEDKRHALWWPPTKIAGRELSRHLSDIDTRPVPEGRPVEIDLPLSIG
jgi:sulfide:quinone oxidoreductase